MSGGGEQRFYRHESGAIGLLMKFGGVPPAAPASRSCPVSAVIGWLTLQLKETFRHQGQRPAPRLTVSRRTSA